MYCHIFKKFQTPCILSCEKERSTKKINFGGFLLCFFLSFSDVFCFLPLQIFPPQPRYYLVNSLLQRGGLSPPPLFTQKLRIVQVHRAPLLHFISFQMCFFLTLDDFFCFSKCLPVPPAIAMPRHIPPCFCALCTVFVKPFKKLEQCYYMFLSCLRFSLEIVKFSRFHFKLYLNLFITRLAFNSPALFGLCVLTKGEKKSVSPPCPGQRALSVCQPLWVRCCQN